jgi:hypothetical protein
VAGLKHTYFKKSVAKISVKISVVTVKILLIIFCLSSKETPRQSRANCLVCPASLPAMPVRQMKPRKLWISRKIFHHEVTKSTKKSGRNTGSLLRFLRALRGLFFLRPIDSLLYLCARRLISKEHTRAKLSLIIKSAAKHFEREFRHARFNFDEVTRFVLRALATEHTLILDTGR